MDFVNNSAGPVELTVTPYGLDMVRLGWRNLGGYVPIRPVRVLPPRQVGAGRSVTVNVMGGHGLPHFRSYADVLEVTVSRTRAAGYLTDFGGKARYAGWAAGQRVSKLVVLPGHGGYGWAPLVNASRGSAVTLTVTLAGAYYRGP